MPIGIQGQGIQHAHPAKSVFASEAFAALQQSRHGLFSPEDGACLGKTRGFAGKERAFTHELVVIHRQVILHMAGAESLCQLGDQELRNRFDDMQAAAAFVEPNPVFVPDPALGIGSVCAKLRRGGGQIGLADDAVKGGLAHKLIELVLIQGDSTPTKVAVCFLDPKGIVQRQRVGNPEEALQIVAAIALQQLLDMLAVLGGLSSGQKVPQVPVADGTEIREPFQFRKLRLVEGVAFAAKPKHRTVLIHQNIFPFHALASPVRFLYCIVVFPVLQRFFLFRRTPFFWGVSRRFLALCFGQGYSILAG